MIERRGTVVVQLIEMAELIDIEGFHRAPADFRELVIDAPDVMVKFHRLDIAHESSIGRPLTTPRRATPSPASTSTALPGCQ